MMLLEVDMWQKYTDNLEEAENTVDNSVLFKAQLSRGFKPSIQAFSMVRNNNVACFGRIC